MKHLFEIIQITRWNFHKCYIIQLKVRIYYLKASIYTHESTNHNRQDKVISYSTEMDIIKS
jgi:hypothetical protein